MSIIDILLVDDEMPFVETMSKRLSRRNFRVATAFSGGEALAQLDANTDIEVVILDIEMPNMDGLDTLGEIKRRFPPVEVIILTSYATVKSSIESMRLGAFDCLMKPCNVDKLITRIWEAVANKSNREGRFS